MKTKLILSLLLLLISMTAKCTIWEIGNVGTTFTPATITITIGDTVNFIIDGSHNAIEVSLATWNADDNTPLSGGFQTAYSGDFVYPSQLNVGTHYYVCSPHAFMGMKGVIIVQNCSAPSQPGNINGISSICANTSASYSISAVAGATSYTWSLPVGWTGNSTSTSISVTAGVSNGNITVKSNNSCGSSVVQTKSITVNTSPAQPAAITGNTTLCDRSSAVYSITPVASATSYTWTLPGGWSGSSTLSSIPVVAHTNSGNISVIANNSCGSSSQKTLAIILNIVDTTVVISGLTLTSNANNAVYQWIDCNAHLPVSGQLNQSFTATVTGNYAVIVTKKGCSDTSSCYNMSIVDIRENKLSSFLQIYPNPSNGKFFIETSKPDNETVEIYNLMGERIYQTNLKNQKSEIDLSNLQKSIYFVKIYNGQNTITKRILVQ